MLVKAGSLPLGTIFTYSKSGQPKGKFKLIPQEIDYLNTSLLYSENIENPTSKWFLTTEEIVNTLHDVIHKQED